MSGSKIKKKEREVEREKPWPRCHRFILIPPPPTSHSLIRLMKSVQAEACSPRQQFYCTICASHIGWQGGEGGLLGAQPGGGGEGRKMKSRMGSSQGTLIPCDDLSAASVSLLLVFQASARRAGLAVA